MTWALGEFQRLIGSDFGPERRLESIHDGLDKGGRDGEGLVKDSVAQRGLSQRSDFIPLADSSQHSKNHPFG
jgi:hypothetical protein